MATRVEQLAVFVRDSYGGDLRRLAEAANGDVEAARTLLTEAPGIGPTGADIVLREAQAVWTWAAPYIDERVVDAAALSAALVRVGLDDDLLASLTGSRG
jgi:endonuclease III